MNIHTRSIPEVLAQIEKLSPSKDDVLQFFIGEKNTIDIPKLIDELNKKNLRFYGGVYPSVIYKGEHSDKGLTIEKITSPNNPIVVQMKEGSIKLPTLNFKDKNSTLLCLLDGLSAHIAHFLDELYNTYSDSCTYIGGGAGYLDFVQKPCVFTPQGLVQDAAILFVIPTKSSSGVKHGWEELKGPFVATETEKNTIHGLNWVSAFDVYKEVVEEDSGKTFTQNNFFDLAKAYPFGIKKDYEEFVVRDPLLRENQSLICIGAVPKNSVLTILKGNKKTLVDAARQAAIQGLSKRNKNVNHCLIFDCISRVLFLGDDFKDELGVVLEELKEKNLDHIIPNGVLTLGEISSFGDGGKLEFFNKTIVVGIL